MRDRRFQQEEEWEHEQIGACEAAATEANALGDREMLLAALELWLPTHDREGGALIRAACPAFPDSLLDDVCRYFGYEVALRRSTWLLIAQALARRAMRPGPRASDLQSADALLSRAPAWAHRAFEDACAEIVKGSNADTHEAWLVWFERPLSLLEPDDDDEARISILAAAPAWELTDVFDMWSDHPQAIVQIAGHKATSLLQRLDFARWFRAVERWKDPRLISSALFGGHILHDRDALLTLLNTASPVFDAAGRWTGATAAVVLVERVMAHARALLQAVSTQRGHHDEQFELRVSEEIRQLRDVELPSFFATAWEALLQRDDGVRIAAAYHAHLLGHRERPNLFPERNPTDIAVSTLARALAQKGVRALDLRTLWEERRRVRSGPNQRAAEAHASGFFALCSQVEVTQHVGAGEADVLAMLCDELASPGSDWAAAAREDSLTKMLQRIIGVVGRVPGALSTLEKTYMELEPSRRRGELGRTYAENDNDFASTLTLIAALGLIDDGVGELEDRRRFLETALTWATRLFLTSCPAFDPTLSVALVFGYALRLAARICPERVASVLNIAKSDPVVEATAVAVMLAEVTLGEIEVFLRQSGGALDKVEARATEWARVTGRPQDVAAVERLTDAIEKRRTIDHP